jgi:hypothetical protein
MVRGDTYKFNAGAVLNGAPVDLTGKTLKMTAKFAPTDTAGQAVFTLSTSNPAEILVTSASGGLFTVTISSSKTTTLPFFLTRLYYDIEMSDGAGVINTLLQGTLNVKPNITALP